MSKLTATPLRPLLLVEDEPAARVALARSLERAGHSVVACEGVDDALGALGHQLPSVAVIDVVLGKNEHGGLDVLRALRSRSPSVPTVMVTAFADVARVKAALNLGASHLLEKPFRALELLPIVDHLLATSGDPAAAVADVFARASLTQREAEVALLAVKGLPSPEIAGVLAISEKTVRQHLSRVYEKIGVSGRGELMHLLFPV